MSKLLLGDEVIVIAGRDKGKRGTVSKIFANQRVLVEKVNIVKKHKKADPNNGVAGGIVDIEKPIHASNVAIYNMDTGKADRIGYRIDDNGKKIRVYKSDGNDIPKN